MLHTLEQIAALAGVSRATVSRVVNGQPNVRQAVRERVMRVVEENHYAPHGAARSLARGESNNIGFMSWGNIADVLSNGYWSILAHGIAESCAAHEYFLTVLPAASSNDSSRQGILMSSIASGQFAGVVLSAQFGSDRSITMMKEMGVPMVCIGRKPAHADVPFVQPDNMGGAHMGTTHLLNLGHARVATITGPMNNIEAIERLNGYKLALSEVGISFDESLVMEGDFDEARGHDAAQALLKKHPSAIFCANDLTAMGAIRAAKGAGLRVPQDLSIVGFDNMPICELTTPPLTSVGQPIAEIGRSAIDLLVKQIARQRSDKNGGGLNGHAPSMLFPTQLMVRQSTAVFNPRSPHNRSPSPKPRKSRVQ